MFGEDPEPAAFDAPADPPAEPCPEPEAPPPPPPAEDPPAACEATACDPPPPADAAAPAAPAAEDPPAPEADPAAEDPAAAPPAPEPELDPAAPAADEPPAAPAAPDEPPAASTRFSAAGETPALCSNLCSNPDGDTFPNACGSCGTFTPCNAFPNPPGKPCAANRSTCSNAIPSAAIAITTPAKLERDSRNSIVCIAFPEPPNSPANPGNPAATHAPDGSRRNSARNSGSTNNRSINRPARSS